MTRESDGRDVMIRGFVLTHVIEHNMVVKNYPEELGGGTLWEETPEKIQLILFREKQRNPLPPDQEIRSFERYYQNLCAFDELVNQHFGQLCTAMTTVVDAMPCCLLCTTRNSELDLESDELMDQLHAFHRLLAEQLETDFTLYLGDVVRDPLELHTSYLTAKYLIQYDEIMQTGRTVLVPADIQWRQADASQILIAEKKYRNCIYLRDYKRAKELAMELLSLETDAAATYCINLKDRVLARADAALDSLNLSYDGLMQQPEVPALSVFEELLHCKTLQDFQALLPRFYSALDDYVNEAVEEYSNQVIDYITSHYSDPGLCSEMICSRFSISYYRLSGIINEYAGVGLIGFIHSLRLTEAKRLLEHTDEKIDVIARSVGYLTARTLNRVFLRYEGTTPREYRQMHKPDAGKAESSKMTGSGKQTEKVD